MALPVKHIIAMADTHNMANVVDKSVYTRGVGDSPKYHVWCDCQWEGWTHDLFTAHRFVRSHIAAQVARGNPVEVKIPPELELNRVELVQPSQGNVVQVDESIVFTPANKE